MVQGTEKSKASGTQTVIQTTYVSPALGSSAALLAPSETDAPLMTRWLEHAQLHILPGSGRKAEYLPDTAEILGVILIRLLMGPGGFGTLIS